ncbi:MAG: SDR family oxidoreductase [Bacteroidales bacterium]|nr:SDR family oxidoreductase [Bacteroidales bacterium]MBR4803074.1 SDR family oxidoreductase [Bacteroidales bacterium]
MGTCIITGAGAGIGKATAILMAQQGYFNNYALIGRSDNDLKDTALEMSKHIDRNAIRIYHLDLAYPEKIPDIMERIDKDLGDIRCLLNIAGYTDPEPLLATSLESFDLTFRVNVYAPFMFMRECVKYMKQSGGKILNVASTAGMTPRPGWLSYASSKAAVISMSETLTAELSEYGIMVYCISPGRCATKLRKRLAPDEDPTTIMQPSEVAEVICNLINPAEQCLDGQNIVIRKKISSSK